MFGFRNVSSVAPAQVVNERGKAQISAPILAFDQYDPSVPGTDGNAVRITLSNLGLSVAT